MCTRVRCHPSNRGSFRDCDGLVETAIAIARRCGILGSKGDYEALVLSKTHYDSSTENEDMELAEVENPPEHDFP